MTARYIASVDQGTASSRCIVFDRHARVVAVSQIEHEHIFPRPGYVEHDATEIWHNVQHVISDALATGGLSPRDLVALGIANQRETTVLWSRETGVPVHNALNWQDMRTDHLVRELGGEAGGDRFRDRCGLPLATYFSGPKIRWLLDNVDGLRPRAEAGDVLFGTIDSWLIWNLTGRHVTDVTNAGRTMLMNLETLDWDDVLLDGMGVPRAMLPEIRPVDGGLRRGGRRARGTPGRRGPRGPARRPVRAGLLCDRRCEVHVRDRELPADEHGRRAGALGQRPADHGRLQDRRASRRPTRWRARSRSPARWCSGSATRSG